MNVNDSGSRSHVIPTELLERAFREKWFKIFCPRRLGGLQCSLPEGLLSLIYTAELSGSLGWVVNLGSGAAYFAPLFDEQAGVELLGDEKTVLAGNGKLKGKAERLEGG